MPKSFKKVSWERRASKPVSFGIVSCVGLGEWTVGCRSKRFNFVVNLCDYINVAIVAKLQY